MFVNKTFTHLTCAESKRCFNVKSSIYYFHMKTKILADFQICISVPLKYPPFHGICFFNIFSFLNLVRYIFSK